MEPVTLVHAHGLSGVIPRGKRAPPEAGGGCSPIAMATWDAETQQTPLQDPLPPALWLWVTASSCRPPPTREQGAPSPGHCP